MNHLLKEDGRVNKRNTSFYLPEETHTLIRRLAEERGTSKNHVVEEAIKALAGLDQERTNGEPSREAGERLEDMRDQVQFLRREIERKDTIIMALTQRVPELEPVREMAREQTEAPKKPFWLRILGG